MMSIRFDDKGKYYTDVVKKVSIHATIQTRSHLLKGQMYVTTGERLKDKLNNEEQYFAVTDVTIFADDGSQVYKTKFLAINKDQIIWLIPDSEMEANQ